MAQKLGIPFSNDLASLGTNAAISDALIEKAVAAGKSEAQINEAMSALWLILNLDLNWLIYLSFKKYMFKFVTFDFYFLI